MDCFRSFRSVVRLQMFARLGIGMGMGFGPMLRIGQCEQFILRSVRWDGSRQQLAQFLTRNAGAERQAGVPMAPDGAWAVLAAPLLAGNDLRSMSAETRDILTNKEVIAIDQDKLGQQGRRVSKDGDGELWSRQLENGDLVLAFFNRGDGMVDIKAYGDVLGLKGKHKMRDLWMHNDMGSFRDYYSLDVAAHGVVLLRIAR